MVFRTAGFQPAHDYDAGWKPAVQKIMSRLGGPRFALVGLHSTLAPEALITGASRASLSAR